MRRWAVIAALALSACSLSAYQSDFECGIPTGAGGCRSLQQVYRQSAAAQPLPVAPDPQRLSPPPAPAEWAPPVKTVWIAPYVDTHGRRHEASILRIIVFPGAKAVSAEPEFLIPPVPEPGDGGGLTAPPAAPELPPAPSHSAAPRQTPRSGSGLPRDLFTPPAQSGSRPSGGFGPPGILP
jgi:hypothetical protein